MPKTSLSFYYTNKYPVFKFLQLSPNNTEYFLSISGKILKNE